MSAASLSSKLTTWFEHTHDNPPAAFNPGYVPCRSAAVDEVASSMEADDYYGGHTRLECSVEFKRRLTLHIGGEERVSERRSK